MTNTTSETSIHFEAGLLQESLQQILLNPVLGKSLAVYGTKPLHVMAVSA